MLSLVFSVIHQAATAILRDWANTPVSGDSEPAFTGRVWTKYGYIDWAFGLGLFSVSTSSPSSLNPRRPPLLLVPENRAGNDSQIPACVSLKLTSQCPSGPQSPLSYGLISGNYIKL